MISSTQNKRIKELSRLLIPKYRKESNYFLVEGYHLVDEAKKRNIVEEIFSLDGLDGTQVSAEVIKKISSTKSPQPIVALCKKFSINNKINNKIVYLENLQDPGNIGTLIRTAHSFGYDQVLIKDIDVYNPKIIRSSQGAIFHISVKSIQNLNDFSKYQIIASTLSSDSIHFKELEIKEQFILILGNEGNGISKYIENIATSKVRIPVKFNSLNVSQAGAILLYEYSN